MSKALIVVDLQNDFGEGGALPVAGGIQVAIDFGGFMDEHASLYDMVVASQDWHNDPGDHWSDMPDFQTSFPQHCEANTWGADFIPELDLAYVSHYVKKGQGAAAFSAFEGVNSDGDSLDLMLRQGGITDVDVIGLATDFCVKATGIGGVVLGYQTYVLLPLTAAVGGTKAKEESAKELLNANVGLVYKL